MSYYLATICDVRQGDENRSLIL